MGLFSPDCQIAEAYARLERNPPLACAYALCWIPAEFLLNIKEGEDIGFYITTAAGKMAVTHLIWSLGIKQAEELKAYIRTYSIEGGSR
jgi:hypothetical protein